MIPGIPIISILITVGAASKTFTYLPLHPYAVTPEGFARIARTLIQEVMPLPFHAVESDNDLQAWGCHIG